MEPKVDPIPASEVFEGGLKSRPIQAYGYDAVGPGWRFILEALDAVFVEAIDLSKRRAERTGGTLIEYYIDVSQVKEKFGGLRVYLGTVNLSDELISEVSGAVVMAEKLAASCCEQCGSNQDVETRGVNNRTYSWLKTLCASCHKKRDESELYKRLEGIK